MDDFQKQIALVLMSKFGGNQTRMAEACGVKPQSVQQWLAGGGVRRKNMLRITEWARELSEGNTISDARAVPGEKFINIPRLDVSASAGMGRESPGEDAIVEMMRVSAAWLAANVATAHNHLKIITASGDSMEPTFRDGDLLLVDTDVQTVSTDAIFVFTLDNELYVKRIQRMPDGFVLIISDNGALYERFQINTQNKSFIVHGRVVFSWNGKRR